MNLHQLNRRLLAPALRRLRTTANEPTPVPPPPVFPVPPRRELGSEPEFLSLPERKEVPFQLWPKPAPDGHLGQLDPEFQASLKEQCSKVELADCEFYHRVRLKDGRFIDGTWNLIGGESEYLGHVELAGKRVLELGPANGWLTTWMELQGASVVVFDVGWEETQDFMPSPGVNYPQLRSTFITFSCRIQNAWWFLHRDYGLSAAATYGTVYHIPADLGPFDVTVVGSILLHLRDPLRALEQLVAHTTGTVIVVEPLPPDLAGLGSVARWNPTNGTNLSGWWLHTPDVISSMLRQLGFPEITVSFHQQPLKDPNHEGRIVDTPYFTVVGSRAP